MSQEIILPDLGMDTDEGLLITWTKSVGDSISKGDILAEMETDKTTVEVESPVEGTIIQLIGEPGENLTVGSVIGYVGEAGESAPSGGGDSAASAPAAESTPEPTAAPAQPAASSNGTSTTPEGRIKASPVAKKVAEDKGIDLSNVSGTGPGGRIVKKDVENFDPASAPAAPAAASSAAPSGTMAELPPFIVTSPTYGKLPTDNPDVEIEDMSRLRQRIAERMVQSKQQTPHFFVSATVNVDAMLALRKELNSEIEDKAARISVNDLIVKAIALTARQFPQINAHYYGDKFVYNKRVNVGIAVALDGGGLINVVSHDADKTAIGVMAVKNRAAALRAREGKVKPDDISGSTITVSNLGMFGVDDFIAIVNPPESAILAVGAAKKTPVVMEDDSIGIATLLRVALSADHRVINGAEAGEAMAYFKQLIENPMRLLM